MSGGVVDNESLEFLGDAVLGFVVADLLFREFPDCDEGEKSKMKATLVSTSTLARQAERLRLGDHLLLGRGEEKTGGRRKQALLADGYEALIAAIYLDGGIEQVRAFIVRELSGLVDDLRRHGVTGQDYKSALQELVQADGRPLPSTGSWALLAPITRRCSTWRSWWPANRSLAPPGRARRKRNRRRPGLRCTGSRRRSDEPRMTRVNGQSISMMPDPDPDPELAAAMA